MPIMNFNISNENIFDIHVLNYFQNKYSILFDQIEQNSEEDLINLSTKDPILIINPCDMTVEEFVDRT